MPDRAGKRTRGRRPRWQPIGRQHGAAQGAKGLGSQPSSYKHFPRTSGEPPWQSHSKGSEGLCDGFWQKPWERRQGLGARGTQCPCTLTPPPLSSRGPEPASSFSQDAAIVLLLAWSSVPFRHYFWPPEEEEKKAKKGVAVLGGTFPRKGFQGLLGQRRRSLLDQKLLCLKRVGRGAVVEGSQGRAQMGHLCPLTLGAH